MRMREYLQGRWVTLNSPLPITDAAQRINKASGLCFWLFTHPARGESWSARLRLNHLKLPSVFGLKPNMDVMMRSAGEGTQIKLVFSAPTIVRFYFVLLPIIGLILLGFSCYYALITGKLNPAWTTAKFALAALAAPYLGLFIANFSADSDFQRLLAFFRDELDAIPVED